MELENVRFITLTLGTLLLYGRALWDIPLLKSKMLPSLCTDEYNNCSVDLDRFYGIFMWSKNTCFTQTTLSTRTNLKLSKIIHILSLLASRPPKSSLLEKLSLPPCVHTSHGVFEIDHLLVVTGSRP